MKKRKLLVLEANIDDMNPQWYEPLMGRLFEGGALDVVLIPSIMKKSRPAVILQVLSPIGLQKKLLQIIFEESTTLGVRSYPVNRFELERESKKVETAYGRVVVKIGRNRQGKVTNASPEYRSCLALSHRRKIPLKEIYAEAMKRLQSNLWKKRLP